MTRPEALWCVYEGIVITGNVFDGDVQMLDPRTPDRSTVRDIVFADNVCEGDILSVPSSTMASSNIVVRGNLLRNASTIELNASDWIWTGNTHVNGTLEVTADAKANIIRDNVTTAPITDGGTETVLSGNVVKKSISKP